MAHLVLFLYIPALFCSHLPRHLPLPAQLPTESLTSSSQVSDFYLLQNSFVQSSEHSGRLFVVEQIFCTIFVWCIFTWKIRPFPIKYIQWGKSCKGFSENSSKIIGFILKRNMWILVWIEIFLYSALWRRRSYV